MSDTPRTDAEVQRLGGTDQWGERWVRHQFAQEIERDLNKARLELERKTAFCELLRHEVAKAGSGHIAAAELKRCIDSFFTGCMMNLQPGHMVPWYLTNEMRQLRNKSARVKEGVDGHWFIDEEAKP